MNVDMEDLLRRGMERFTDEVKAPPGLAARAGSVRTRRKRVRAAAGTAAAAVVTAVVLAVTSSASTAPAQTGASVAQAATAAYVIKRVENALAGEQLVFHGDTTGAYGPSATWAYGRRSRFEELTGSTCGHARPNGSCTHHGGSERYLADGTAMIGGKLTSVYVTYFDRKWSGGGPPYAGPSSACSTTGAMEVGGPGSSAGHWPAFIKASLACGAATVTGHVRINGVQTTKITGTPVTVKLPPGEARAVREKQARVRWTLYVSTKTYLPVRMSGSMRTFGGPAASTFSTSMTNVQWLRPTRANIARTLVTIPAGFRRVSSPASQ